MSEPLVSVLMPVRNEAGFIARSLGAILAQDYPPERLEVLIADGESDDGTPALIAEIVARYQQTATAGMAQVRLLHNPARLQAAGLNRALHEARGSIIVRVDGHTLIAPDYVRACVATLAATGASNVGGRMDPVGETPAGRAIALATTSRFGVPAAFHTTHAARATDTVYMGAWPREVLLRLGGFDEALGANEDYELNYRIRQAGGTVYLAPSIRSTYYCRPTLAALARQYYCYGQGKVGMLRKHPASLRPRQLVAPAFVAALVLGAPLALWSRLARACWLLMLAAYAALTIASSARRARGAGWQVAWRLPLAFLTLHTAWGAGFWAGLLRRGGHRMLGRAGEGTPFRPPAAVRAGAGHERPGQ